MNCPLPQDVLQSMIRLAAVRNVGTVADRYLARFTERDSAIAELEQEIWRRFLEADAGGWFDDPPRVSPEAQVRYLIELVLGHIFDLRPARLESARFHFGMLMPDGCVPESGYRVAGGLVDHEESAKVATVAAASSYKRARDSAYGSLLLETASQTGTEGNHLARTEGREMFYRKLPRWARSILTPVQALMFLACHLPAYVTPEDVRRAAACHAGGAQMHPAPPEDLVAWIRGKRHLWGTPRWGKEVVCQVRVGKASSELTHREVERMTEASRRAMNRAMRRLRDRVMPSELESLKECFRPYG